MACWELHLARGPVRVRQQDAVWHDQEAVAVPGPGGIAAGPGDRRPVLAVVAQPSLLAAVLHRNEIRAVGADHPILAVDAFALTGGRAQRTVFRVLVPGLAAVVRVSDPGRARSGAIGVRVEDHPVPAEVDVVGVEAPARAVATSALRPCLAIARQPHLIRRREARDEPHAGAGRPRPGAAHKI